MSQPPGWPCLAVAVCPLPPWAFDHVRAGHGEKKQATSSLVEPQVEADGHRRGAYACIRSACSCPDGSLGLRRLGSSLVPEQLRRLCKVPRRDRPVFLAPPPPPWRHLLGSLGLAARPPELHNKIEHGSRAMMALLALFPLLPLLLYLGTRTKDEQQQLFQFLGAPTSPPHSYLIIIIIIIIVVIQGKKDPFFFINQRPPPPRFLLPCRFPSLLVFALACIRGRYEVLVTCTYTASPLFLPPAPASLSILSLCSHSLLYHLPPSPSFTLCRESESLVRAAFSL